MSRLLVGILCIIACVQLAFHPFMAIAADINYTPATASDPVGVKGEVPVNKIGVLLLADASCIIAGTTIVVAGKASPTGPHQTQIQGHIVNNQLTSQGKVGQINGKAYFDHGPNLKSLGEPRQERVILHNGHIYNGHIVSVDDHIISFQPTQGENLNVPLQDVKTIESPHAFNYTINIRSDQVISQDKSFTAHTTKITFHPTQAPVHQVAAKEHFWSNHPFITAIIAGTIVATAITVPVVLGVAAHHHHERVMATQNNQKVAQALLIKQIQAHQSIINAPTPAAIRVLPTTVQRIVPTRGQVGVSQGGVSNVGT